MSKKLLLSLLFGAGFALTGCGGGGGGGGGSATPTPTPDPDPVVETTSISGKVNLSSTSSKPVSKLKTMLTAPKGKVGSKGYLAGHDAGSRLHAAEPKLSLTLATVYLYDSNHPEWLDPIAAALTDSSGNFTLDELINASNNDNAYTDGDSIPAGNYTMIASKFDPGTGQNLVAVQTIVNEFSGTVSGTELTAQPSDVSPEVQTMFGVKKNTDGTETWGSTDITLSKNAAIQVTFSMAMARESIVSGISISPAVDGKWAVSSDWLSATFYLADGASLTGGQTYTITVEGGTDNAVAVRNVYGNPLETTAVGTFAVTDQADTQAPTAQMVSPTVAEIAAPIDVITPIRVGSNEPLDVNNLLLSRTADTDPSFGVKPGVMFVGKNDDGLYVYEFLLGDPLKLDTTYNATVSGGTDLAGNVMNPLTVSFSTVAATEGIDANADAVTKSAQADVKDVFGKWVRAMNDRNLAQLQSLMSGDFVMEYDTGADGIDSMDVNRDGRYSMKEFSDLLANAFTQWEYCGTAITGTVVGNININASLADFQFTLDFVADKSTQDCKESGPDDAFYLVLEKINGAWQILRASEGIDTRDRTFDKRTLISLVSPTHGEALAAIPDAQNPMTFEWDPVDGVSSYIFVIMDDTDPYHERGRAFALPNSMTSLEMPFPKDQDGQSILPFGVVKVHDLFDFNTEQKLGLKREGKEFIWEVLGMGTTTTNDLENDRVGDPALDIVAASRLSWFKIPGTFKQLGVTVKQTDGTEIGFSEFIGGYNADAASQVDIVVNTPNVDATMGMVNVSGNTFQQYPLDFTAGAATVRIDLNQGFNWVEVVDDQGFFDPMTGNPDAALQKGFNIQTTGGVPPVIVIDSVIDDLQNTLASDGWDFYDAPGASSLVISGTIDTNVVPNPQEMYVNVGNQSGAQAHRSVMLNGQGTFNVEVDIFPGDNWINLHVPDNSQQGPGGGYNAQLGVYTDTGSEWVPPISATVSSDDTGGAVMTEDYGDSANWDASADSDNLVTITGRLEYPEDASNANNVPHYDIGSPGGWQGGDLTVAPDGSYTLEVELFHGWNNVNLFDVNNNWYGVNIYTETGKEVIRPEITTLNGATPPADGQPFMTDQCSVTIVGTAIADDKVEVNWNGWDGTQDYWDQQRVKTDSLGNFSATVPVVSGSGANNFVDIFDGNYNWTGFPVETSATCAYTPPVMTVDDVQDSQGGSMTPQFADQAGAEFDAPSETSIAIIGTDSMAGRAITVEQYVCGDVVRYAGSAGTTDNGNGAFDFTLSGLTLFDGPNDFQVTDGNSQFGVRVMTSNGVAPPPPAMEILTVAGGSTPSSEDCYRSEWQLTSETSATITGHSSAGAGMGHFQSPGSMGEFTIDDNGDFSFSVDLYDGFNSFFVTDTKWNGTEVAIMTTNGVLPPQYVTIGSPTHQGTVAMGTVTVTGAIATPQGAAVFNPMRVGAWVNDWQNDTWMEYSSDPNASQWGAQPLTFNPQDGSFTFDISVGDDGFGGGAPTQIEVWAEEDQTFARHGHSIVINDPNAEEWIYKPSSKAGKGSASRVDVMKRVLKLNAKH